ncbi:MAG TPA: SDR family oxidoreductase [Candidatus Krumholzibacteria bacterium]|nr:SDR family oxidoreductase [Candidatus Krumholzibacteria bacterium]HPD72139.1 SDR family oxidoreductase [Candidatus Krumholzibacteria bacterium]HRY40929.1 SDR family oxidoreductase [Candidatus Krumholzibacteria bacterium]
MNLDRRQFLKAAAAAGAALGLGLPLGGCTRDRAQTAAGYRAERADHPLDVLILGGTSFLGPACVEAALARGHTLTLFNRGRTNPHLFPDLEKLQGDRDGDLEALAGRRWDAVIDTSGYVPRQVRLSAGLLGPNVGHYVFISSISVYRDLSVPGMDESAPLASLADPASEDITDATYGALKALCEQAAEDAMPGRVTAIRPGLIAGPRDRSDRFTYWPVRVERGGEVLAPGTPADPIQFIDVRDLAEFVVHALERRLAGAYNCDSPAGLYTMGTLLGACREVTGSDAVFTWCDARFLAEHRVAPWTDLPCWVPAEGADRGFGQVSTERARAAGLGRRPLATTARDTLAWWKQQPADRREHLLAGLSPEREVAVLRAWRNRR